MLVVASDDVSFEWLAAHQFGRWHGGPQLLQSERRVHPVESAAAASGIRHHPFGHTGLIDAVESLPGGSGRIPADYQWKIEWSLLYVYLFALDDTFLDVQSDWLRVYFSDLKQVI